MAEQVAFGQGNVQILVKESENVHIEVNGIKVATFWVPPFRKPLPLGKTRDLSLLLASTAITELIGREQLWQDCLKWCKDSSLLPFSVRCITGNGGSGKTRFALELVHHLRGLQGWDARFVRFEKNEAFELWAKTSGSNHVLLVFDYAGCPILPAFLAGGWALARSTIPNCSRFRAVHCDSISTVPSVPVA